MLRCANGVEVPAREQREACWWSGWYFADHEDPPMLPQTGVFHEWFWQGPAEGPTLVCSRRHLRTH